MKHRFASLGFAAVSMVALSVFGEGVVWPPAGAKYLRPTAAPERVPYASDHFAAGVTGRATGAFHVETVDGREWVIDPLGRGTLFFGVQSANVQGVRSEFTGRARYLEWNRAHGGEEAWRTRTLARLRDWGFNFLSHGCARKLEHRGLAHAHELHMGQRLCEDALPAEYAICRANGRDACSSLPDMFHPDFPAWCRAFCAANVAPYRDDPWTAGWFIDNELKWWGTGNRETGFFDAVLLLPPERPARRALEAFVAGREVTTELKREFLLLAARRYFKITSEAIRAADPNHLVLGCRFAGVFGAGEPVWRAAGEYCDIVTFNIYPWCDLDRNVVRNRHWERSGVEDLRTMREMIDERHAWAKKPMMITEWSFRALDSGNPNTAGAGQVFLTQRERAQAADMFLTELGTLPYLVGHNFFRWVDQPPEGIRPKNLEDGNYGLVNERDEPYERLVDVFRRRQRDMRRFRASKGLLPRAHDAKAGDPWRQWIPSPRRGGGKSPADALETGASIFAIDDGCGFRAEGKIGSPRLFDRVALAATNFGFVGFTVGILDGDRRDWLAMKKVVAAERVANAGGSSELQLRIQGGEKTRTYSARLSVKPYPDGNLMRLRLVDFVNTGAETIRLRSVYFSPRADYRPEDKAFRHPKDIWKGPVANAWIAEDGRWTVAASYSPFASFRFWLDERGIQHPDAAFFLQEPVQIAPGGHFDFGGQAEAALIYGFGGFRGWQSRAFPRERASLVRVADGCVVDAAEEGLATPFVAEKTEDLLAVRTNGTIVVELRAPPTDALAIPLHDAGVKTILPWSGDDALLRAARDMGVKYVRTVRTNEAVRLLGEWRRRANLPAAAGDFRVRDPFILADPVSRAYYLYETTSPYAGEPYARGVCVRTSRDLVTWSPLKPVMRVPAAERARTVWAPEVHRYRGRYWMFATLTLYPREGVRIRPMADDPNYRMNPVHAAGRRGVWVYVADSPEGPFEPVADRSVTPEDWLCLDGTLVVDGDRPCMVFCHEWVQTKVGRMDFAPLADDLSRFTAPPQVLFDAKAAPGDNPVTDGPFCHRSRSGKLFMIWSKFIKGSGYSVILAESASGHVEGPWVNQRVIYGQNGGHAMVLKTFEGALKLVLHGPERRGWERLRILDLADTGDGSLSISVPSTQIQ